MVMVSEDVVVVVVERLVDGGSTRRRIDGGEVWVVRMRETHFTSDLKSMVHSMLEMTIYEFVDDMIEHEEDRNGDRSE